MTYAVGDVIPAFTITVTSDSMKAWAAIMHDPNPIHLDPEAVRAKGRGNRVINQGPANVAYVMNALHAAFPGGAIESCDARFLDNMLDGDVVEASGRIVEMEEIGGIRRTTCDIWLTVLGRDVVLRGRAVVSQPIEPPK